MNKYLFLAKICVVAETPEEAKKILRNDPAYLAEDAEITDEKYTAKKIKGFTPWMQ